MRSARFASLLVATLWFGGVLLNAQGSAETAVFTSGTLNIILANKNGFVIGADSRMSGDTPFPCSGSLQLYCDNSQKVFRTGPVSAMAIAGFAVGRQNTPLDLTVASALRKSLEAGVAGDQKPSAISSFINVELGGPLTAVAAIHDPTTSPSGLSVIATFARLDDKHRPVIEQMQFTATWVPMGPLNALAPQYNSRSSGEISVTRFQAVRVGITFIAEGILQGVYKSADPVLQNYYRRLKKGQLDDMPIDEMKALALVILRETKKYTDLVGGDDQVGVFPENGETVFSVPDTLPKETQLTARTMRWEGLICTKESNPPPCGNVPVSFTIDSVHPLNQPVTKFLLASEFRDVSVALDDNLFVADSFDGVTLKWHGNPFYSYRNTFKNCVLELTPDAQLSAHPELAGCHQERKSIIDLPPETIGLPMHPLPEPPGLFTIPSGFHP